jgi:Domain of unknown function (DUF397)
MNWRRSTACESITCVEVAMSGSRVWVRQSVDPGSPVLEFTRDEWVAFLAGAKSGEFD